ncbi:glycine betaine/L-proline ABC transporter, substrate-binding subunit [Campylobacter blaseri]|uniref:Glycine/betaine ABC transporter substrate-binding protein n=1 Tax=Campylobacter blaseri TaxID=2042961 RepID=A0A2P8R0C5_9BACT|nr:glycine betaine ABC transporter substrate-binding protein [Campylobacter blaseri]PSM51955.1 glycine/betaine ABC transporter substrate-binding protein [Campylobacter blaseri]PSM53740.1 glycine/betaine ABC transporter substrate-binding protein [Campylobacter blaseri]QKF85704.1 glycine betaine/L-proline ABC transporter, substrate-binding subunit [Campylobacter blaseri]
MKRKTFLITGLLLALSLLFTGCNGEKDNQVKIKVGSKDFTENQIVAELYSLALEDEGFNVERVFDVSSAVIHNSIYNNDIDVYPEYTGTGLLAVLKMSPIADPDKVYQIVKKEYKDKFNIEWLDYSKANDGQGLVIATKVAQKYGIKTISDLQKNADKIRFASQGEFNEREDALPALEAVYGHFNWKSSKVYDNSLKYQVLKNDEADVAPAYTTEGRLTESEFMLLEDDKKVWPPYNLAPVVRAEVLTKNPKIKQILNKISAALNTENLTKLNAEVDIEGKEYKDVAKSFYQTLK